MEPFVKNSKEFKWGSKIKYIPIKDQNIDIVNGVCDCISSLIEPYGKYFEKQKLGHNYNIKYDEYSKTHFSQIRFDCDEPKKYPTRLFLVYRKDFYDSPAIHIIYFLESGKIEKADLQFHSKKEDATYEIQIRASKVFLYVKRISKTIYYPPYGTKHLYEGEKT